MKVAESVVIRLTWSGYEGDTEILVHYLARRQRPG